MTPEEYADHFRRLAAVAARMGELVEELREAHRHQQATNAELREFNRQQVEINQDVKTTLARIETLLTRMLPPSENGRDA
jgi:chromosome segregation ATPase